MKNRWLRSTLFHKCTGEPFWSVFFKREWTVISKNFDEGEEEEEKVFRNEYALHNEKTIRLNLLIKAFREDNRRKLDHWMNQSQLVFNLPTLIRSECRTKWQQYTGIKCKVVFNLSRGKRFDISNIRIRFSLLAVCLIDRIRKIDNLLCLYHHLQKLKGSL